jgi:uncharacterized OB-fold protein
MSPSGPAAKPPGAGVKSEVGMATRPEFPLPDLAWAPTAEFWAGAARDELRIPRCDACGRLRWYPEETCRRCEGVPLTWETLSGAGTLFSWVVVTHAFLPQFADLTPFVPALVAVDEDAEVRIPTRMVDCEPAALDFGMPVQVVFRPLEFTGVAGSVLAPVFRPA